MEYIHLITKVMVTGMLIFFAIVDIRKKEIPNFFFLVSALLISVLMLMGNNREIIYHLLGTLVGIVLILISKVTRGRIGVGDGLTFCILGMSVGLLANVQILMLALFASAIYAIILLVIKHVGKNHAIPFIPFILIGYIGVVLF